MRAGIHGDGDRRDRSGRRNLSEGIELWHVPPLSIVVLVLLLFVPFAEPVRKHHATSTSTAHHPAPDQQAHEPPLVIAPILLIVVVFILVLVVPEQATKQKPTQTAAAHYPAPDQKTSEPPIPATLILILIFILVVFVLVFLLMPSHTALPEQAGEQQPAQAAPAKEPSPD